MGGKILSESGSFRALREAHSNLIQIWGFRGENEFLSHFYPSPISAAGVNYPTVEHAYQAYMTLDMDWRRKIRKAGSPEEAKSLSRMSPIRPDKDNVKLEIMLALDKLKFETHPELLEKLKATGHKTLVEGNVWHDNFWGDCRCSKCRNIVGQNHAGKILMKVRDELCYA